MRRDALGSGRLLFAPLGIARSGTVVQRRSYEGPDIPDSVVYQYRAEDFASPWPDQVGSADMTVNGLAATTFPDGTDAVAGDGSSHGLADGPQTLGSNSSFAVAFTVNYSNVNDNDRWFGVDGDTAQFRVYTSDFNGSVGNIRLWLTDTNGNNATRGTQNTTFDDGNTHSVVINKPDDNPDNWDVYVDDMDNDIGVTTGDTGFDSSNFAADGDLAFFAGNNQGSIANQIDSDVGVFEFWDTPLTQTDREDFVSRRPEVSAP